MGKTLKKYLLFDLDTTALKEEFGPKRYTVAYSMIRQFLENCGFEHKQGSGYLSTEPISLNQIIAIYQAMTEEMPWLDSCSKTMDVGNVRGFYNLKTLSQNLVADNAVDNSQLELADFDRVFPTVGISHDESMPGWYSLVPIYSDRKLYEHVRANKENKTLVMAYLIISLLTIAQLATIIIFLNNLVQIFV